MNETKETEEWQQWYRDNVDISWLKPGIACNLYYQKDSPHNDIIYFRQIVDNDYVVCCKWNRNKWQWDYFIEHLDIIRYNHHLKRYINIIEKIPMYLEIIENERILCE